MLGENWNVLRLLNRKSARMPTETHKSTTQHTTGGISRPQQRRFTRTTPRIQGLHHVGHRLFSLNSNPFLFTPLLWKLCLFYLQHFILPTIALCYFSPTHFSVSLTMSSIITFSPSLSCLISHLLPVSRRYFSFFSTMLSVYPLHLPSKCLLFLSSSVSGNWGGLSVWRCADLLFVEAVFAQTGAG